MKFNHKADSISESFDIKMSTRDIADKVTDIVKDWITSADASRVSVLGEKLHEQLPYEVILFLATQEVYGKVTSTMSEMKDVIDRVVKSFVAREEDNKAKMN